MLKITLLSILIACGYFTVSSNLQGYTIGSTDSEPTRNPEDMVMSFSYDMNILTYNKLVDENDETKLSEIQRLQFIPQKQSMHVRGHLETDGTPFLEINILEKTQRSNLNFKNDQKRDIPEVRKVVMRGRQIISYDARGKELLSMKGSENQHRETAKMLLQNIDPSESFKIFIDDMLKKGAKIHENEMNTIIEYKEENKDIKVIMDKEKGVPNYSEIKTAKDLSSSIYKYECINGKYVLVMHQTTIVPTDENPDVPLIEYVSLVQLENVQINN